MLASRKDRQEIQSLYEMPSNPQTDTNPPWKGDPIPISVPSNESRNHATRHKPPTRLRASDHCNPYSSDRMKSTLGSPIGLGKRRTGLNDKGPSGGRANFGVASRPHKRVKLQSAPRLGPEVIDVDYEKSACSSPDPINDFDAPRSKPPTVPHDRGNIHAFDLNSSSMLSSSSSIVASTSRLPKDGRSTRYLEMELQSQRRSRSSSPIEQFEDGPRRKSVKERVHDIEEVTKQHTNSNDTSPPYVDFREKLKTKMKGKNTLDPVATSSSGFTQKGRLGRLSIPLIVELRVPMKACYIGSMLVQDESYIMPLYLARNPDGRGLSISCTINKEPRALAKLHVGDMHFVEFTESTTPSINFGGMPVLTIEMDVEIRIREPLVDSELVGTGSRRVTIKLDTGHSEWKTEWYNGLLNWLRTCNVTVRSSRNGKQMWEMAERVSNALKLDQHKAENLSEHESGSTPQAPDIPPVVETRSNSNTAPEGVSPPESIIGARPSQLRRSARHSAITIKKPRVYVDPDEVILVYPQGMPGAINITNADISRLRPGEFLNDTLIEFGLKLWHKGLEMSNPDLAKDVHVFSSFFYKKLNKKNFEEGYQSVRKWTSKINIFEKKYIIIPINEHLHWYLAIIYMPQYILQPPPLQPVGQKLTSRTRSRTNKPTIEAQGAKDPSQISISPASATMVEAEDELNNKLDELRMSCITTVLEASAPSSMSVDTSSGSPECPGFRPLQTTEEFAMDVDKTEEDAVREQLQVASPAVSDLETDDVLPSTPELAVEDMEIDRGTSGEKENNRTSRFFSSTVGTPLTGLDPPVQETSEKCAPESEPQGEAIQEEEDLGERPPRDDSEHESDEPDISRTYIFTLDSLGTRHPQATKQLNKYLKMEALHKLENDSTSDAISKMVPVPTQPNFCDCGIYLLHFAQTFMTDPARYFKLISVSKKPPPASDRRSIWQDHKVGNMRQELADRIKELSEEWQKHRATKEEGKKDRIETVSSSDSEIEYVEAAPIGSQGKTAKDSGKKNKIERTSRLRGQPLEFTDN